MLAYVQQTLQEEAEKEQLDINDLATTSYSHFETILRCFSDLEIR
jgi:hypothetical protein